MKRNIESTEGNIMVGSSTEKNKAVPKYTNRMVIRPLLSASGIYTLNRLDLTIGMYCLARVDITIRFRRRKESLGNILEDTNEKYPEVMKICQKY